MSDAPRYITVSSTVDEWIKHPVGGPLLLGMLAKAGRDESALKPVRELSLERLISLSGGMFSQDVVDYLLATANEGVPAPEPGEESAATGWQERITPGRFDLRTIIVTGAAGGIGRATASRIAREGGRVVAVDIDGAGLDSLRAELPGENIVPVVADITSPEGVARIVEAAGSRIDGLANVAGVADDMTPLHEVSLEMWERVFRINVDGTFLLTRAVLPAMLAARAGSIVNVASEAGLRGSAAGLAYTASKHAVVGMTKSSAFMYGASGIRVNAVAPGPVATGIESSFASELGKERIREAMAILPAIAEPRQLASSIAYLLSDDATNITGVILPSDGGWSAA